MARTKNTSATSSSTVASDFGKHFPAKTVRGARIKKEVHIPSDDPVATLRKLTREHQNWTRKAVAIVSMQADRKNRTTGETIHCTLPADVRGQMVGSAEAIKRECKRLEKLMTTELAQIPIYTEFLSKIYGMGPIVASYLVACIDIRHGGQDGKQRPNGITAPLRDAVATKISHIIRYCGYAVDTETGRLERPKAGKKLGYNSELRTRLYQWHSAMSKNSYKKTSDKPYGTDSKYIEITRNALHRLRTDPEFDEKKNIYRGRKGGKAITLSKARCKAIHVFLEDLYIVWRTLDNLPIWPSFYSAKMGYQHGGMPAQVGPRSITLEEAMNIVSLDKCSGWPRGAESAAMNQIADEIEAEIDADEMA